MNSFRNENERENAKKRYVKRASEVKGWAIGPMPEEPFLERFLPYSTYMPPRSLSTKVKNCGLTADTSGEEIEHTKPTAYDLIKPPHITEEEMYEALCADLSSGCDENFIFVRTSAREHIDEAVKTKPDICLYPRSIEQVKKLEIKNNTTQNLVYITDFSSSEVLCKVKKNIEDDPCVDLPGLSVLFKEKGSRDAQEELNIITGQIASHAKAILSRQHRTHCFSIGVFGSKARFYRWDRAGVVISRAFSYKEKPLLREFARRYCQATDAQRGRDLSVCRASGVEEDKFKEKIREHVMDLYAPKDEKSADELVKKHYEEGKVFKIRIWPQQPKDLNEQEDMSESETKKESKNELVQSLRLANKFRKKKTSKESEFDDIEEAKLALQSIGQAPLTVGDTKGADEKCKISACRKYADDLAHQYFLVSRPVANNISIAGRATRGYWSVKIPDMGHGEDANDYRICFLKDTWRIESETMEREGDIMVELFEAGVEYVSDIICHSDVRSTGDETMIGFYHETKTNELIHESWNSNQLVYTSRKHIHYRMVSVEVGCPLRELLGAYELLEATRTAFIALLQTLIKCKRLHCDISIDNILIIRKGGVFKVGNLIDWEFSCKLYGKERIRLYKRSGTWAFMSYKILRGVKGHKHGLLDDMESLFYVVLYSGINWLPHNQVLNLGAEIDRYFYKYIVDDIEPVGGGEKSANIEDGRFTKFFKWEDGATKLWMSDAWELQYLQWKYGLKERVWTPENFMSVWTDALKLNPPKANRFEHVIRIDHRDFSTDSTTEALPATNSVTLDTPRIPALFPTERGLKRSFGEIMTVEGPHKESMPAAAANGSSTRANSKRLRQAVPILDPYNNSYITKTGSQ